MAAVVESGEKICNVFDSFFVRVLIYFWTFSLRKVRTTKGRKITCIIHSDNGQDVPENV